MGRSYNHLSLEDRCEISRLQANGCSIRQIAAALGRQPSSISRELKRNSGRRVGYKPSYADEQAQARRWTGSRLERDQGLRDRVLDCLKRGWSPEQIAGRFARDAGARVISHETIYRFIYAQIARTNDYSWRLYLPRAKSRRGFRGKRGGSPASFIKHRVSIAERPPAATDRSSPGHWEADRILFAKPGQAILTLHERQSRAIVATRPRSKAAAPIVRRMASFLGGLPPPLRQTVTIDNGTEFAEHYKLHDLHIATFFCDPHSPWQKGGIENAIGRMRRFLPRKTDLAALSERQFLDIIRAYNTTPRKCLDYRTPAELFIEQLLHFGCESTPRLAPG